MNLYPLGIRIASIWNDKATLWIRGRKNIFKKINEEFSGIGYQNGHVIWMHCASLGEFEQGLPLVQKIKEAYPGHKLVITFFSPSGYEIKKDFKDAAVYYLPPDSPSNARRFIKLIRPELVLWIKYEYWYYYLAELKNNNIPILLISGAFRKGQPFFKWYGSLWKKMLTCFDHFFLQNEISLQLLKNIGVENTSVSGDTRFDRVISIAENFTDVPMIQEFCGNDRVIVAGSTWEDDEAELVHYARVNPNIKFIIAPHEIDAENLAEVKKEFPGSIFYSELDADVKRETTDVKSEMIDVKNEASAHVSPPLTSHILIIDNIGMLSRLYKYADITYVGGGFGYDGLHNILEAAVFGKPVLFGPEFDKNFEAAELIDCGGAICIENALELEKALNNLWNNKPELEQMGTVSKNYVYRKAGATQKIVDYIQENRLLTS